MSSAPGYQAFEAAGRARTSYPLRPTSLCMHACMPACSCACLPAALARAFACLLLRAFRSRGMYNARLRLTGAQCSCSRKLELGRIG
eukprot:UN2924